MSNSLVTERSAVVTERPAVDPAPAPSAFVERRRPGRIENASPELIALMRNPASRSARMRVALYDAPGFLLPAAHHRPRADGRTFARMAVAMTACSVACTALFKAMLLVWG